MHWVITARLPEDSWTAEPFVMYLEADNLIKAATRVQSYCKRANFEFLSLAVQNGDIPANANNITRK